MRIAPGSATLLLAVGLSLSACAPAPTPSPAVLATPAPASSPSTSPTAAPTEASTASPTAAATGSGPSGSVIRDDSLLAVLPPDIDGNAVAAEEQSFDEAAADPAFTEHVARAAFAVVTSPNDLASGVVAELRPGTLDDAFFTDWRETYDEGACSQAGGVGTIAETQLGGRTVWITTCGGGLTVYHTRIPERNLVVSLFALGEGRYGERLMRDLRP